MKKFSFLSIQFVLVCLFVGSMACSKGGSGGDKITVGSSCEGIGSMEARMSCEGANTLFCSSLTGYKFKVQNTCPEGQVCQLAANGKSASCVAQ